MQLLSVLAGALHGRQYIPYMQHASHSHTVMEEVMVAHARPPVMTPISANHKCS